MVEGVFSEITIVAVEEAVVVSLGTVVVVEEVGVSLGTVAVVEEVVASLGIALLIMMEIITITPLTPISLLRDSSLELDLMPIPNHNIIHLITRVKLSLIFSRFHIRR